MAHTYDTRTDKRIPLPGSREYSVRIEFKKVVNQIIFPCKLSPFEEIGKIDSTKIQTFRALLDTGSVDICITEQTAKKLQLTSIGTRESFGSTGSCKKNIYVINLHLPWGITMPIEVMESADHADFDLIIGMNIISKGELYIINSCNKTTVQFKQLFL
ncbi:MAG: hypothetical protein NTW82_14005 [Bacteroidia bacterium]|nr:hypothetical protein [Bacteroidia bacterium]